MAQRRILLALIVLASVSGCDPRAGVYIRQPLSPASTEACIGAALRESPLVASVTLVEAEHFRAYDIEVRDSTLLKGHLQGMVKIDSSRNGQALVRVGLIRWGAMTWTISKADERHLSALGSSIAAHLRAACAPGAPATVGCRIEGFGPSRDCEAAG